MKIILIITVEQKNQFEFRKEYKLSANDFNFVFGYKCKNTSCLPPQGAVVDLNVYALVLFYSGYEINHQNEISPLEPKEIPNIYYISPFEDN